MHLHRDVRVAEEKRILRVGIRGLACEEEANVRRYLIGCRQGLQEFRKMFPTRARGVVNSVDAHDEAAAPPAA